MTTATIDLEVWQPYGWEHIASVRFAKPNEGLLDPMEFTYSSQYVAVHGELKGGELVVPLACRAGTHLFGGFFNSHNDGRVAAVLRDIIPSGWAGNELLSKLGIV